METKVFTIDEICSRFSSGKNITSEDIHEDGEYPVYGGNGLRGYTDRYNFEGQCSIIGRQGAYCGNVRYFNGKGYMSDHAVVAVTNDKHDNRYFAYKLGLMDLGRFSGQAAQPGISVTKVAKLKVEMPSLPVQRRIASILSAYDNLIDNNNRRIRLLEQMAESLYKEWFVRFRFPGHEQVEMENGLPKGWKKVSLSDVLSKITTGLNPRKNFVLGQGDNYYVTIKNMGNNNIYLDDNCDKVNDEAIQKINKRSDLKIGDILFSGIGTIGRVYLITIPTDNWNVSESVFTMRANEKVTKEFLYMLLLSDKLQNYCQQHAQGVAQPGIRMSELKDYKFYLPTEKIISAFNSKVSSVLSSIDILRKQNKLLTRQRDLLLPRLMSGKLEVKV